MKLLTKALEKRFDRVGRQEEAGDDAVVITKYFTPDAQWTWFATEWDPEEGLFFGYVDGMYPELGYFSLRDLETARGPMGLPIERDLYWREKSLGEVMEEVESVRGDR